MRSGAGTEAAAAPDRMSDDVQTKPREPSGPIPFAPPGRGGGWWRRRRAARVARRANRPRVRKLRLTLILIGLGALAIVSTIFGMMMAVASDLPQLENRAEYRKAANSFLY